MDLTTNSTKLNSTISDKIERNLTPHRTTSKKSSFKKFPKPVSLIQDHNNITDGDIAISKQSVEISVNGLKAICDNRSNILYIHILNLLSLLSLLHFYYNLNKL